MGVFPHPHPQPLVKSYIGMIFRVFYWFISLQSKYKRYLFPSQAALIMQVLSLTDQQISLLPADQRQSIMVLKEQIAHSTQPN